MFSAYLENPRNYHFEGQDLDENILLLLRAHPITNLSWIFPAIMISIFPFLMPMILMALNLDLSYLPSTFNLAFLLINYLLVLVIVFEGFLHWYFNVYIVTDKNIIDVNFYSVLSKSIDAAPIRNVEDTSSSMAGLLNSIFNYGNVLIQTAGTGQNIDFTSVPKPHQVADFILDRTHHLHKGEKGLNDPSSKHA